MIVASQSSESSGPDDAGGAASSGLAGIGGRTG